MASAAGVMALSSKGSSGAKGAITSAVNLHYRSSPVGAMDIQPSAPPSLHIPPARRREALQQMLARQAYRRGSFLLASGRRSEHYVNCKPVSLSGAGATVLAPLLLEQVHSGAQAVAGLTLGADPLVSCVAMAAGLAGRRLDALIVRKEPKGHGIGAWIEGPLPPPGARVTVLEDVVTTGNSCLKAVQRLREAGYVVEEVVAVVDRREGGQAALAAAGLHLKSLFLLEHISTPLERRP